MDRMQRFALKKTADGLDKVLKAKEHFDKREEKKSYTKKAILLKQYITDFIFHGEESEKNSAYEHVSKINEIQARHDLSSLDKKYIDELLKLYKQR